MKTKIRKIGANIQFNETMVSISYMKPKNNIIRIQISEKSQATKNSRQASNLTLAKVIQIQKKSCC